MTLAPLFPLALLLAVSMLPAGAQTRREFGAHEHGVSRLQVAIEGGRVEMMLEAPGMDITGFEYAPASADDRTAVDSALAQLRSAGEVVGLPDAAGCVLVSAEAEHETEADEHAEGDAAGEDHGHEDADESGGHSAFRALYAFDCATPEALTEIALPFFALFPRSQDIAAEWVTDAGAGAAEVTRDAPVLRLR